MKNQYPQPDPLRSPPEIPTIPKPEIDPVRRPSPETPEPPPDPGIPPPPQGPDVFPDPLPPDIPPPEPERAELIKPGVF